MANICLSFNAKNGTHDIDLAAFAYDIYGNMLGWAFDKTSFGQAIVHSGDTGNGNLNAVDESIFINFNQMPPNVQFICIGVALEDPNSSLKDFDQFTVSLPEMNAAYDFLQCGQPQARTFVPFVLVRNGAQFMMTTPNVMSQDVSLDHIWPLIYQALQTVMLPANYQAMQKKIVSGGETQVKKGQHKYLHHSESSKHPDCEKFYFGLGWETRADLDSHVFLLDEQGNSLEHVYYGNKKCKDHAVKLDGDDTTGDGKKGADDETVEVDTSRLNKKVHYIVFGVEIYTNGKRFSDIDGEFVRVYKKEKGKSGFFSSGKDKEVVLAKYNLDYDDAFNKSNAGVFCVLSRVGKSWRFDTITQPCEKPINKNKLKDLIFSRDL